MIDQYRNILQDVRDLRGIAHTLKTLAFAGKTTAKNVSSFEELIAVSDYLSEYADACVDTIGTTSSFPSLLQFLKQKLV